MIYCTYDEYQTAGGTLDEAAFDVCAARASRMIDSITFDRAETHVESCDRCRVALSDACIQIIGILVSTQNTFFNLGYAPGVASVSNDGLSVSFSGAGTFTASARSEARQIVQSCLGSDPHSLLYRGCF